MKMLKGMALTMIFACFTLVSFSQDKETIQVWGKASLAEIIDLEITGGDIVFDVSDKAKYKNGVEFQNMKVKVCATCDWKLKYDIHGKNSTLVLGGVNDAYMQIEPKPGVIHQLPLNLIGVMVKPDAASQTFFNNYIQNNFPVTKPAPRWATLVEPKTGQSNIGEEISFGVWWSLAQAWSGTNLFAEQIHAGMYEFKVVMTAMCIW